MTTLFNTSASNKATTYRVQDFLFRFRKLQQLCHKLDLDGILIICGYDSLENEQYAKLTSWLFTGYAGSPVESDIYLDPIFKEFVFLIYKDGAACYAEPTLFESIEKYLIAIPNVKIYSPTEKEMENTDDVELTKIAQFYKMVKNLTSVGVCLGSRDDEKITNIEKWPLLQAYGLDVVGCGFFGLNHNAQDITNEINKLYEDYDKYLISNTLATSVKQMEHHLSSTWYIIDSTPISKRNKITETQLNAILKETFEFTIIKKPSIGNFVDLPKPRVLFGKNTNKDFNEESTDISFAQAALPERKAPLHFTLEYVEPLSKLRVARTYFSGLNETSLIHMKENKDEDERVLSYRAEIVDNGYYNDEKLLLGYYAFTIKTFNALMEYLSSNIQDLNQEFIEKKVCDEFSSINFDVNNVVVHFKCYNANGDEIKPNAYQNSQEFVNSNIGILRIQLKNIKSLLTGDNLGSILFCESFYIQPGVYFNITKRIPHYKSWTIDSTSSDSIEKIKDVIICEELGKPTSSYYESVYLYIPSSEAFHQGEIDAPVQRVKFRLYENGFKITSEAWGAFVVFYSDIDSAELHRKLNKPALAITFKKKPIMNAISKNAFYIFFSGFAASDVFLKFDQIFAEKEVKFTYIEEFPTEFETSVPLYQSEIINQSKFQIPKIQNNQILDDKTFIKFLEYQEIMKINTKKDLTFKVFYKITEFAETTQPSNNEVKKFEVFFINGTFNSGKNKFADNLAKNAKALGYNIHIFRKRHKELLKLNNKLFVEDMLRFLADKSVRPGDKILIVLPSVLNTKLIVDNILRMPEFTEYCDLRAIITKINLTNFYQNANKEICENFLTFCTAGYSQFIIMDNYGTDEKEVDRLTSAFRSLFTHSAIYRINSNIVHESLAKDILTSNAFDSKINKIERKRNIPFKAADKKYIYIPFKVPLLKEKVQKLLYREILIKNNGYLFEEEKEEENIKREKVDDELLILKSIELKILFNW